MYQKCLVFCIQRPQGGSPLLGCPTVWCCSIVYTNGITGHKLLTAFMGTIFTGRKSRLIYILPDVISFLQCQLLETVSISFCTYHTDRILPITFKVICKLEGILFNMNTPSNGNVKKMFKVYWCFTIWVHELYELSLKIDVDNVKILLTRSPISDS